MYPTPPARKDFYPRSPCGERPLPCLQAPSRTGISIHVPLAGNVLTIPVVFLDLIAEFLSTFPLRGTSCSTGASYSACRISIHVPLAGNVKWQRTVNATETELFLSTFPLRGTSAWWPAEGCCTWRDFYPRSPCGERPPSRVFADQVGAFLSTFPLRGTSSAVFQAPLPCG